MHQHTGLVFHCQTYEVNRRGKVIFDLGILVIIHRYVAIDKLLAVVVRDPVAVFTLEVVSSFRASRRWHHNTTHARG